MVETEVPGDCQKDMKMWLMIVIGLLMVGRVAGQSISIIGCVWLYGTGIDGSVVHMRGSQVSFKHFTNAVQAAAVDWEEKAAQYAKELGRGNFEAESNYAVALMHLGRSEQALAILERLGKEHPEEYVVAANLGTAYELNGQNEKAHEWIKRGMELNADSHYGTEWLHLKILEAKLALGKDPEWLQHNSILGYDFGKEPKPVLPAELTDAEKRKSILRALEYQLQERMQFVKPPDPIVADLLFDLANIIAFHMTIESAVPYYDYARTYGSLRGKLIEARKTFIEKRIRWSAPRRFLRNMVVNPGYLIIALIVLVPAIWITGRLWMARQNRRKEFVGSGNGGW